MTPEFKVCKLCGCEYEISEGCLCREAEREQFEAEEDDRNDHDYYGYRGNPGAF